MTNKDYYQILKVHPSASQDVIKKAYRKLALQYHPDKTNNALLIEHYTEIKEAYEVLSNPGKRKQYHYSKFFSNYDEKIIVTLQSITEQAKKLQISLAAINPYHIDFDILLFQIDQILLPHNILILKESNDDRINQAITSLILDCLKYLPYKYIQPSIKCLLELNYSNIEALRNIEKFKQQKSILGYWEKYKIAFAIAVAILLCMMMYTLI